jgi:hypothetical protein
MRKLFMLFACFFLFACNNDKKSTEKTTENTSENKTGTSTPGSNTDNIITFNVSGQPVSSTGWNINRFDFGAGAGTSLNVTSNMHEQPKTININVNGDVPGTYTLGAGTQSMKTHGMAYGSYAPDYLKDMSNTYSFQDGEFVIVSIDTTAGLLNATFHGTVKNTKGESLQVTDGKVINGRLKAGISRLD